MASEEIKTSVQPATVSLYSRKLFLFNAKPPSSIAIGGQDPKESSYDPQKVLDLEFLNFQLVDINISDYSVINSKY